MNVIEKLKEEIETLFEDDVSGHDYHHSLRVYRVAMKIADTVACNRDIVAIAALLHDADDIKLFSTNNYENARSIMSKAGVNDETAEQVVAVIKEVPFRGTDSAIPGFVEGKIVQDADRLDALGAIGIARTFAYGGSHGRPIYDPNILADEHMDGETYQNSYGSSVNHFYEKLFKLKNMMNTKAAYNIALQRDAFLRQYMDELLRELEEF